MQSTGSFTVRRPGVDAAKPRSEALPPDRFQAAAVRDGKGGWAPRRGWPRVEGHRRGADAVPRTVQAAPPLGITTLTLFAFSSDNWKRPTAEVGALLRLFAEYLESERAELLE